MGRYMADRIMRSACSATKTRAITAVIWALCHLLICMLQWYQEGFRTLAAGYLTPLHKVLNHVSHHSWVRCKEDLLITSSDAYAGWERHCPDRVENRRQGGPSCNMHFHFYKRDSGQICGSHSGSHILCLTLQYDLTK